MAEFLAPALRAGGVAVIVATPEHGGPSPSPCARPTWTWRRPAGPDSSSSWTPGRRLTGSWWARSPDPVLFEEVIGGLLRSIPAMPGDHLVYGGRWPCSGPTGPAPRPSPSRISGTTSPPGTASHCCAPTRPAPSSAVEATADFLRICERHSGVIPAESLAPLDPDLQHRSVTRLQQQAAAARTEREELRQHRPRPLHCQGARRGSGRGRSPPPASGTTAARSRTRSPPPTPDHPGLSSRAAVRLPWCICGSSALLRFVSSSGCGDPGGARWDQPRRHGVERRDHAGQRHL